MIEDKDGIDHSQYCHDKYSVGEMTIAYFSTSDHSLKEIEFITGGAVFNEDEYERFKDKLFGKIDFKEAFEEGFKFKANYFLAIIVNKSENQTYLVQGDLRDLHDYNPKIAKEIIKRDGTIFLTGRLVEKSLA